MPRATAAPPAWVWAAGGLLALAVLAATLPAFVDDEAARARPADLLTEQVALFEREGARVPASLRVIAFGDSSLATATLQLDQMAAYARQRGLDLDFLRLWLPWCQLHQVLPGLAAAVDARPDLVMLDSWTLVYALDRNSARAFRNFGDLRPTDLAGGLQRIAEEPSLLLRHQAFLFDRWTGATEGQMPIAVDAAPKERQGRGLVCDAAARRRLLRRADQRNPDSAEAIAVDPLVRQALVSLIEGAAARGVRIVFFDIPKAPAFEALPGVRKKRAATRDFVRELARGGAADYLEFPGQIDDEDTCDYVHYVDSGRDRYMPWFVDQLRALRAGGGGR